MKPRKTILYCLCMLSLSVPIIAHSKSNPETLPSDPGAWGKLLGKKVSISGTAQNAKLGAVLLADQHVLYIKDKESWEPEALNRRVHVTGTLRRIELPVATQKDGAWSAGVSGSGSAYQLEKIKWELCR